VIERAAIMAAGADSSAVINWIMDHDGTPDTALSASRSQGLHGSRMNDSAPVAPQKPTRFVLSAESVR
jgi:hypothetical protein